MNICMHIFMWTYVFMSHVHGIKLFGLYGKFLFNFLRKYQTMFPSGYSSSHSYQFLHILSILLIVCVVFFIISALPASIQKYLTVVSFLYWLMMSSIFFMFTRHLYIFLGAICIEIFCFNWITLSYY